MKRVLTAVLVATIGSVGLVGCGSGSAGGPGASNRNTDRPNLTTADDTFTLDVPNLSTTLKQSESKVVEIGINRGKNFGQDVTLKLDGLPQGVSADPASPTIKAGEANAKVTLKASDTAALGDFTVKVTGHPAKGADATNTLKLTIEKK